MYKFKDIATHFLLSLYERNEQVLVGDSSGGLGSQHGKLLISHNKRKWKELLICRYIERL